MASPCALATTAGKERPAKKTSTNAWTVLVAHSVLALTIPAAGNASAIEDTRASNVMIQSTSAKWKNLVSTEELV